MRVLTLNAGSSSLKFGLFDVTAGSSAHAICLGSADALGSNESRFQARWTGVERMLDEVVPIPDHAYACTRLQALFDTHALPWPNAVAHRIVHGGATLRGHALIDDHVLGQIQAATSMAPLHTPAALAGVRFAQRYFSTLPQIACLDTAFHADMPEVAQTLSIARRWRDVGVRRYGFHGLSCASILYQLGKPPARLVIAHLGHGASVTAVRAGRSIDNSMGFSPGGGVMMATRCGDIDPGVLIYLAREHGQDADRLETLTDHQSGLLGVSGLSGDMRVLRAAAPTHADARLAMHMFAYSVARHIAAMTSALQGLDMLVFTGGIGEHDAISRAEISAHLEWLGIRIHAARNATGEMRISTSDSACAVAVMTSQEDLQMARYCHDVLRCTAQTSPS